MWKDSGSPLTWGGDLEEEGQAEEGSSERTSLEWLWQSWVHGTEHAQGPLARVVGGGGEVELAVWSPGFRAPFPRAQLELCEAKPGLAEDLVLAAHPAPSEFEEGGCIILVKPDKPPGSRKLTTQFSFSNTCSKVIK